MLLSCFTFYAFYYIRSLISIVMTIEAIKCNVFSYFMTNENLYFCSLCSWFLQISFIPQSLLFTNGLHARYQYYPFVGHTAAGRLVEICVPRSSIRLVFENNNFSRSLQTTFYFRSQCTFFYKLFNHNIGWSVRFRLKHSFRRFQMIGQKPKS